MSTTEHNGFLLGSVRLVHASQTLKLNSRKALGLLGYLAQQGRPIDRDWLIELLWSEDDAPGAKGSMRTLLKNLRKQLGEAFYADRQVVALEPDAISWDIDRFSHLAAQDDIAAWVQASTLYQGEFMRGFQLDASLEFDDWLEITRHFWFDAVNRVLRNISDYYLHHDQAEKALAYTRRWLELEPWQEKAHRQQMWLHWQLGNFAEALAQYERCVTRLEHDLDVAPSSQTFELYELILKDQSAKQWQDVHDHALPAPPAATPAFAPTPASTPAHTSDNAPIPVSTADTSQLSLWHDRAFWQRYALSSFFGRERQLRILQDALQQHRLVSVIGLPGVGKSHLVGALLWGARAGQHAFGGVHVLDGTTLSAAHLEHALATTTEAFLLFIDGLAEPFTEVCDLLVSQLATQPQRRVLVTARAPLGIVGEKRLYLSGLELPPANAPWQDAVQSTAVRLLIERVRLRVTDFTLNATNTPFVVTLCRLVSGLPHALERLAAELELTSVDTLSQRLGQTLATHEATWLTTLLEAAWQPLDDELRWRYATCAVLADGFDAQAAQSVSNLTVPQLRALIDRSLLEVQAGRYVLPQVFRPRLLEHIANCRNDDHPPHGEYGFVPVAARQADYYLTRLTVSDALTAADNHNVQRAWRYVCDHQSVTSYFAAAILPPASANTEVVLLARYLPRLVTYYCQHGSWQDLLELLEHSWHMIKNTPTTALQLEVLAYLSRCALQQGDALRAQDYLEQAHTRTSLATLPLMPVATSHPNNVSAAVPASGQIVGDSQTRRQPKLKTAAATVLIPINKTPINQTTVDQKLISQKTIDQKVTDQKVTEVSVDQTRLNPTSSALTDALNALLLAEGIHALLTGDHDAAEVRFQVLLEQPNYQLDACLWLAEHALQQGNLAEARAWQRALEARGRSVGYEHATELTHHPTTQHATNTWLVALRLELASAHTASAQRYWQRLQTDAEHHQHLDVQLVTALYGARLCHPNTALEQALTAFNLAKVRTDRVYGLQAASTWLWLTCLRLIKGTSDIDPSHHCEMQHYVLMALEQAHILPKTSLLTALFALAALCFISGEDIAYRLAAYVVRQPATPYELRQQAQLLLVPDAPDIPDTLTEVLTMLLPVALNCLTPCDA